MEVGGLWQATLALYLGGLHSVTDGKLREAVGL